MATVTEEIAAIEAGIKELDKAVVEATAQRKEENSDYKELTMNNNNAKEVLLWAKNRLNKVYNPKLYKSAHKRGYFYSHFSVTLTSFTFSSSVDHVASDDLCNSTGPTGSTCIKVSIPQCVFRFNWSHYKI